MGLNEFHAWKKYRCALAARRRHVPGDRWTSAPSDFKIMASGLASDRQSDRLRQGRVSARTTQDALEINRVVLPQAGVKDPGSRHADAIAVLAEIVGQGRDEADLPTRLYHARIARWSTRPFSQINQRPALLDQATQRCQREKLIGTICADLTERHGFNQRERHSSGMRKNDKVIYLPLGMVP